MFFFSPKVKIKIFITAVILGALHGMKNIVQVTWKTTLERQTDNFLASPPVLPKIKPAISKGNFNK